MEKLVHNAEVVARDLNDRTGKAPLVAREADGQLSAPIDDGLLRAQHFKVGEAVSHASAFVRSWTGRPLGCGHLASLIRPQPTSGRSCSQVICAPHASSISGHFSMGTLRSVLNHGHTCRRSS